MGEGEGQSVTRHKFVIFGSQLTPLYSSLIWIYKLLIGSIVAVVA